MPLILRPTGLASPVSRDQLDYTVIEDGREIGRMYEDRSARPELRWFWSIVVFVGSRPGIATHGRTATIEDQELESGEWQERVTRARRLMRTQ